MGDRDDSNGWVPEGSHGWKHTSGLTLAHYVVGGRDVFVIWRNGLLVERFEKLEAAMAFPNKGH